MAYRRVDRRPVVGIARAFGDRILLPDPSLGRVARFAHEPDNRGSDRTTIADAAVAAAHEAGPLAAEHVPAAGPRIRPAKVAAIVPGHVIAPLRRTCALGAAERFRRVAGDPADRLRRRR